MYPICKYGNGWILKSPTVNAQCAAAHRNYFDRAALQAFVTSQHETRLETKGGMAPPLKKRKIDAENRQFNTDWTMKNVFIETVPVRPMCLLCSECISLAKECNQQKHLKTKHSGIDDNYPLGLDGRQQKTSKLQLKTTSLAVLRTAADAPRRKKPQPRRLSGIYPQGKRRGVYRLAVKEYKLAAVEEVVTGNRVRFQLVSCFNSISMLISPTWAD